MNRTLQVVAWSYAVACLVAWVLIARRPAPAVVPHVAAAAVPVPTGNPVEEWFAAMKPFCNSVEVEVAHRRQPAPQGVAGTGYSAACFALAGRIDRAQALIESLPDQDRVQAASIVFNVGHPVADAGDDLAAGPIMELVVHYWPTHYMALYHAGMSAYALDQHDRARTHLREFLKYYSSDDGWRRNAIEVLGRLGVTTP